MVVVTNVLSTHATAAIRWCCVAVLRWRYQDRREEHRTLEAGKIYYSEYVVELELQQSVEVRLDYDHATYSN